jgi:hypothetical protein
MDLDPDPAIFVIHLKDAKKISFLCFSAYFYLRYFTSFLKKNVKKSQNSMKQGFSYFFA